MQIVNQVLIRMSAVGGQVAGTFVSTIKAGAGAVAASMKMLCGQAGKVAFAFGQALFVALAYLKPADGHAGDDAALAAAI